MLQVLCGPARHAILAILYDDEAISAADARIGLEALVEQDIADGKVNRRCEICDKSIGEFRYEDGVSKEQDWDKAKAGAERLQDEQMETRTAVMAARRAARN